MADLLRATKHVPDFHACMSLHLIEMSPVLRQKQAELLATYNPTWHVSVETLPQDGPLYIVANEFFDALPIRQRVGAMERVVGLDANGNFVFGLTAMPAPLPPAKADVITEYSPARDAVMTAIATRIAAQGGMMLAIDYGHDVEAATGDTLQAVYRHQYCPVLEHIGDADMTSHVDFWRLKSIAKDCGCSVFGSVSQKDYLEQLGIATRLEMLKAPQLEAGVIRLCDPMGMGGLFRVLAVTSGLFPAGFGNPA
jgi:SAM-dependent MidA family methyltransferase